MSGHSSQGLSDRCLTSGINDSIAKPLQRELLVSMVQKWTDPDSELNKDIIESNASNLPDADALNGQAPIDLDSAIEAFMGEKEIFFHVLDEFICQVNAQINSIRAYIAQGDLRRIASEAHAIKGGAANLLAVKLSSIAAQLENAAIEKPSGLTPELVDALEAEYHRLREYLEQNRYP